MQDQLSNRKIQVSMQSPQAGGAIVLAVHRPRPDLLGEQIRTIADQSLAHWRCHVGIDGTDESARDLVARLVAGDDRFVIHHYDESVGIYRNFERLIGERDAAAPWLALSDQDDSWDRDKLERLVSVLDKDAAVTAVVGQARLVDVEGRQLGRTHRRGVPLGALILDNQVTGSLSVFRSRLLELAAPFPEPTPAAYHDHWLGVVAASTGRIAFLDEQVQDYVQHAENALGEEGRRGPVVRLKALAADSGTPRHMLGRLAEERWGWRSRMASTLVTRLEGRPVPPDLHDFARARTVRVSSMVCRSILRRQVSAQRALAVWVGFAWARLARPSITAELEGET